MSLPKSAACRHIKDTLHFRKAILEKHAIVLSDSALNAIGLDSLLGKIENVHLTLDRINNTIGTGFDTHELEKGFPEVDSNVTLIDENLTLYDNVIDVKNLQMFEVLLADLQRQVVDWRDQLFKYDKDLEGMNAEMNVFRHDTVLHSLMADTAFRELYITEIKDLKSKWAIAKKEINDNQGRIKQLQSEVSNEYFETIDLQNKINALLQKINLKSLGKEYEFLWDVNSLNSGMDRQAAQLIRKSYHGQRKILHYYFERNWQHQFWLLVTGLLFLFWVLKNFKRLKENKKEDELAAHSFSYINKMPVLSMLVVMFAITTFFDIHPPTAYVVITELLMVIILTILLARNWPRDLLVFWIIIACLYVVVTFAGTVLTPRLGLRIFLASLSAVSVVFGLWWFIRIRKHTILFSGMIKFVSVVYILLNAIAFVANLYGRLSLAKIFSVTAIYGLTQVVGLSVLIQIVTEAFQLQTLVYRLNGGLTSKLNFQRLELLLRRTLIVMSVGLWTVVFCISLNMYNMVLDGLTTLLTTPRKIGGTSFEIINILLFVGIIYISNQLQQGVGALYGKTQDKWDPEVKKNSSRLAMTRLFLIVVGFLIAVAASGLPMDKITIVLGALGVGIGLGLQTIVNNLVSGVILIFEQPFRIGDFIEIGDKKGRVLDISIRSSKIVMEEGAQLIIPNADLLSGRVINWTLRDDNARIEFPVSIESGHSFEEVQQIIKEALADSEYVTKDPPPEILLLNLNEKAMNLNVLVWINDVHLTQSIRSHLLNKIFNNLKKHDIKIS